VWLPPTVKVPPLRVIVPAVAGVESPQLMLAE
jgi:hypothetical protein